MLQNLAAVAANYRRAGIRLFVLAYFVRNPAEVQAVRKALGVPLRVARLTVPFPDIERRLAGTFPAAVSLEFLAGQLRWIQSISAGLASAL